MALTQRAFLYLTFILVLGRAPSSIPINHCATSQQAIFRQGMAFNRHNQWHIFLPKTWKRSGCHSISSTGHMVGFVPNPQYAECGSYSQYAPAIIILFHRSSDTRVTSLQIQIQSALPHAASFEL
jgi:hypothetical protein